MPVTYKLIASATVGSGGSAQITFSSIPQTYTDLVVKYTGRLTTSGTSYASGVVYPNNDGVNISGRQLYNDGGTAGSNTSTFPMWGNATSSTASTFSNGEIYIPNYAGNTNKSASNDIVVETNSTSCLLSMNANIYSQTTAITRLDLYAGTPNSWQQHSTFYLYGISKS